MTQELGAGELNLLGSEYGNMLSCVRCGQCLTSCPTYVLSGREAEGPRGRVALARAVYDGVLPLTADLLQHEQNCLICDACTAVCPAGVHMDPLQVAFRTAVESHVERGGKERLIRALGIVKLLGLEQAEAFLPKVSWPFLMSKGEVYSAVAPHPGPLPEGEGATPVSFFAGCVMSTAMADIDRATIRVLQRAGCD